jgi:uncharacterized protein DUF3631
MIMPDDNVVPFQPSPASDEERARRLKVEVERLARLPAVEWIFYLDGVAEKHGIESSTLRAMIERIIKEDEKRAREQKVEARQQEVRVERQRTAAQREEERRQREQRRAQEQADKEAEKRQREREKAFEEIAKLPATVHEQQLAELAKRSGDDLDFLRGEFSRLVAAKDGAAITSTCPELWPEPVDLNALLLETMAQIQRYVVIHDEAAAVAIILWIAFAWVHGIAVHSPILRIVAGDIDAGKTTLCGVLGLLTPRAATTAELTGPALFRFVDQVKPTLIVDNADKLLQRKPDLVTIIESSWTRGTPIPRVVDGHVYLFEVFCPKVLAGIALALNSGTMSRCIDIKMLPKLPDERVQDFGYVDDDTFIVLRRKWARWAADNAAALRDAAPAMAEFNNRIRMNWKLQFAIANLAGGDWPKQVRAAAVKLTRQRREPSEGKRLLEAFQQLFAAHGPVLTSAQVLELLTADPDSEWADFHGRGPITKWRIAQLLDPYDIHPEVIHPHGRKAERGYRVEWFEVAFRHYLGKTPASNRTSVRKVHGKPQK